MANELMNVPNWGFENVQVYDDIHKAIRDFAEKFNISYYFLEYIFKKFHRVMLVKHSAGVRIWEDIYALSELDIFSRFIKRKEEFVEFKWKGRIQYILPFPYYEVSRGLVHFLEFSGYKGETSIVGGIKLSYVVDFDRLLSHLGYMFSHQVKSSSEFEEYMGYWSKRLFAECLEHEQGILDGTYGNQEKGEDILRKRKSWCEKEITENKPEVV